MHDIFRKLPWQSTAATGFLCCNRIKKNFFCFTTRVFAKVIRTIERKKKTIKKRTTNESKQIAMGCIAMHQTPDTIMGHWLPYILLFAWPCRVLYINIYLWLRTRRKYERTSRQHMLFIINAGLELTHWDAPAQCNAFGSAIYGCCFWIAHCCWLPWIFFSHSLESEFWMNIEREKKNGICNGGQEMPKRAVRGGKKSSHIHSSILIYMTIKQL